MPAVAWTPGRVGGELLPVGGCGALWHEEEGEEEPEGGEGGACHVDPDEAELGLVMEWRVGGRRRRFGYERERGLWLP